jgi:small multidrug resistance pump
LTSHLLLTAAITAEVVGTLLLKRTDGFTRLVTSVAVLACYSLAFVLLARVIQAGVPVAIAYATWSAIGLTAIAALSAVLFDEKLSAQQVVAIALIVGGVVVLEVSGP